MNRRFLAFLLLGTVLAGTARTEDLRSLFINMPDSIMPALTRSERMDFLDYIDSNMRARVSNKLGGESEMTQLKDDMLSVRTSQSGRMDMVLFPRKNGHNIICIIRTATARYDDSRLLFYNEDWSPVNSDDLIELPVFDDYLTKEALKADSLDYFKKLSMLRLQSVTPVNGGLEFRYTSLDYIGEDAGRYKTWIKPEPLRYIWNGKRFKRK